MVQKPCTPIRSAKGNPARPLIGGPPLRAHRTQWHGFTGQGLGLLDQVGTGPHRGHRTGARPALSQHGHQRQHRGTAPGQGVGFRLCLAWCKALAHRFAAQRGTRPPPFRWATTQGRTTLHLTQCKFYAVAECPAWPQGKRAPNQEWAFSPSTNW